MVAPEILDAYVIGMEQELASVLQRLRRRLQWALDQLDRLDRERRRRGTLDPEEDSLRERCDRLIKRLKGVKARSRREAEGYDDTNTYAVLAAEGSRSAKVGREGSATGKCIRGLLGTGDRGMHRQRVRASGTGLGGEPS